MVGKLPELTLDSSESSRRDGHLESKYGGERKNK